MLFKSQYIFLHLLQVTAVPFLHLYGLHLHMSFIYTGNMRNWKEQDDKQQLMQVLRHLLQCMKCWDCHGRKLGKVLNSIVTWYTRTREHNLFELLSDLALSPNHTYIYRYH